MRNVAFTNLHVSDGFWSITARDNDGEVAEYDLTEVQPEYRSAIADALIRAIKAPGSKKIKKKGMQ